MRKTLMLFCCLSFYGVHAFLNRNPQLYNPACRITAGSVVWQHRAYAYEKWGMNFIQLHMLIECPPDDPLEMGERLAIHQHSFRNLESSSDISAYLQWEAQQSRLRASVEQIELLSELMLEARRAFLLMRSKGRLQPVFDHLYPDFMEVDDLERLASLHGAMIRRLLSIPTSQLLHLKEVAVSHHVMLVEWETLMREHRRDLQILLDRKELHLQKGEDLIEVIKRERQRLVTFDAAVSVTEEQWLKVERQMIVAMMGEDLLVDGSLEIVRLAIQLCLGDGKMAKPIAAILLHLRGLISADRLLELCPVSNMQVPPQAISVWFEDRLLKYLEGPLFPEGEIHSTRWTVQMMRHSLARLPQNELQVQLLRYSVSCEYSHLCLNRWMIEAMQTDTALLLKPKCFQHALSSVIRKTAQGFEYHVLNSGQGNELHQERVIEGWKMRSASASFHVSDFAELGWLAVDWSLGALNEYSTVYPPRGRYEAAWEALPFAYKKGQEGMTCSARAVRLAIQFLQGEEFWRQLKAQMALDWLPPLLQALQHSEAKVAFAEGFLRRWQLGHLSMDLKVVDLFALNTVFSFIERKVNQQILDILKQLCHSIRISQMPQKLLQIIVEGQTPTKNSAGPGKLPLE